ncbi:unnamed protein product [Acanthoscelides obtectus]|uniref:acireductone dioxygenase (Fe(2+)-requiring) n=1 Tax=Acanthoscelides obtectus TaxID=200917 RepID=A0A9P0Q5C0_ACAOB|nr:unnamed protein product [Acanthoscelides obtectus]CAK1668716.1 1,2-dihydroxy-3-keto-5-methylthiopentene dioxygenase [Acanthoscelides obtectus]
MVRAWFIDEDPKDPRAEHHRTPPKFVSLEELYRTTGVEYFQVDPKNFQLDATFRKLIEERGNQGIEEIEDLDPNDLKVLYVEHFHTYDEFRICLEGCGYYDIRDKFDEWIRVEILPGDLLVIPGGCYHRFTVDKNVCNKYTSLSIKYPNILNSQQPRSFLNVLTKVSGYQKINFSMTSSMTLEIIFDSRILQNLRIYILQHFHTSD